MQAGSRDYLLGLGDHGRPLKDNGAMLVNLRKDDLLRFKDDPDGSSPDVTPWKILIVDDDEEVHGVTKLALADFKVHGRPLAFLDAYTGADAVKLMRQEQDVAIILMDVVMENEHAGLDAVEAIRKDLRNNRVRIVLRTGQPGQAPESEVVSKFDINDYKEKTELTTKKLYTVIHTGLSHYRELVALDSNRRGLHKVIEASAQIFEQQALERFAEGVLQQLAALLYAGSDAVLTRTQSVAAARDSDGLLVLAGTGAYASAIGRKVRDVVSADVVEMLERALREKKSWYTEQAFIGYFGTRNGAENVLYMSSEALVSIADQDLIELFCRNVSIAFENLTLREEMVRNQREMVVTLSETIESRSLETGNHVRRVAEYSRLLGQLAGLSEQDVHLLYLASPLHDTGKIAVPDSVLGKPGAHNTVEMRVMRAHAEAGRKIFEKRDNAVLRAAAIVAGQHHERWDGKGYPDGLAGENIHVFGRITAIADVFDALCSRRCYKEPWPMEQVLDYLRKERGAHFDPKLIDLFFANVDRFHDIRARFPDPPDAAH
jgi:response regulator RpfG family c-di-GMP phosphodiesterase